MASVFAREGGYGGAGSVVYNDSPHANHIIVPDAQLLFTADFRRAGSDLVLTGHDGRQHIISGYFASANRPTLVAPNGASLPPDLVDARAGCPTPGAYAQAQPSIAPDPIGKVEKAEGEVTVIRDGIGVALNVGAAVFKNDVVETGLDGLVAIVFVDGTTFQLYASGRMVLDEFICGAQKSSNSALFRVVKGLFGFIAGKVATTGRLIIDTPLGQIQCTTPAAGFGSLAFSIFTFGLIHELKAASADIALYDYETIDYKYFKHGVYEILTKEAHPRRIVVGDPGARIEIRLTASGSVSVTQVANTPVEMAQLQSAWEGTHANALKAQDFIQNYLQEHANATPTNNPNNNANNTNTTTTTTTTSPASTGSTGSSTSASVLSSTTTTPLIPPVQNNNATPSTITVLATAPVNELANNTPTTPPTQQLVIPPVAATITASNTLQVNEHRTVALGISETPANPSDTVTVTIAGVPIDATLSAGTNNGNGSWTVPPAQLTGLILTAGEATHTTLTITATTTNPEGTTASTSQNIPLTINPVAPTLTVPPTLTVNEDGTAALGISETPFNPNDTVSITITGVPSDATLSAGTKNSDGSWTLTPAQLSGLNLTAGEEGHASLTVTATNTEGATASANQNISLTVNPVAEAPTLALGGTTATVNESGTVVLPSITATPVDSDDTLTLTIAGLASGATITDSADGTVFSGASFTLTGAEVGSTLTLHDGSNEGNFSLTVTANNTAAGETASSAPQSIAVTVTVTAAPMITVPGAQTLGIGQATPIPGVSVAESGATGSETFTVTLVDSNGQLSANTNGAGGGGTITSGAGGTSLSINGTLTQVNADLTTLSDTDGTAGSDTITVNALDSFNNSAPTKTIAVDNVSLALAVSVLGTGSVQEGQTLVATATVAGDANDANAPVTYQWQSSSDGGLTWQSVNATTTGDVNGILSSLYQMSEGDEGKLFRATASFTDDTGQLVSAVSAPTTEVADITPTITVPFSYAVDELKIVKNSSTAFDDTFTNGPPPVGGNFNTNLVAFGTNGSIWTEANGKAIMSASGATPSSTGSDVVQALLLTSSLPEGTGTGQSNGGLKENATFTVSGTYDLALPPFGSGYGIELTNGTSSASSTDVVQLRVDGTNTGGANVDLYQVNISTNTFTLLKSVSLTAQQLASNTQIELDLAHSTVNTTTITGSFELFNNGSQTFTDTLSTTANAFATESYTRAELFAFANPAIAPAVTISGTAQEGQTLMAVATTNDTDATILYQWEESTSSSFATFTDIGTDTDSPTYTVQASDVGSFIRVVATTSDTDNSNTPASATSAATAVVVAASPEFWGNVYFPSEPTSGVHVQGGDLTLNTFTKAGAVLYLTLPNYDPENDPAGPYSATRTVLPLDPFFLPDLAGNQIVVPATETTLPAKGKIILPSVSTANGIESEGLVVYETLDGSGNNVLDLIIGTGGGGDSPIILSSPTQIESAGTDTIYNLELSDRQDSGTAPATTLTTFAVAWDEYNPSPNPSTSTFNLQFQIFNPPVVNADGSLTLSSSSGVITPAITPSGATSLTGVSAMPSANGATTLPAWEFRNGGGIYALAVDEHNSTTDRDFIQFQGYNLDGTPNSGATLENSADLESFQIQPVITFYTATDANATNHITQDVIPGLNYFPGSPSLQLEFDQVSKNNASDWVIGWNETITDVSTSAFLGDQVEFVVDKPGTGLINIGSSNHYTAQLSDVQAIRVVTFSSGTNDFVVLAYGDATATHLVEFEISGSGGTVTQIASITDPTTVPFANVTSLGDGRIAVEYDNVLDSTETSQNDIKIFDFRTTGLSINDAISFTGVILGTQLMTSSVSGTIKIGDIVDGPGIASNTTITGFVSGINGGAGTYTISTSQTVSSEPMTLTDGQDQYFAGTHFSDTVTGENNVNNLYYYVGEDFVGSTPPSDTFHGGSNGWNVAVFPDARGNYTIVSSGGGTLITNVGDSAYAGSLTVDSNVQALAFDPAHDPLPHGGSVEATGDELYIIGPLPGGSEPITIDNGSTLALATAEAGIVTFAGSAGEVILTNPTSFTGSISGITQGDANQILDLGGFGSHSGDSFTVIATQSGADTILLVTDTSPGNGNSESVTLSGNETTGNGFSWTATADGHGGANVIDPAAAPGTLANDSPVIITDGASATISASSSATVTFTGGTGSLVLNDPDGFTGQIIGFTGTAPDAAHSDTIDLVGIDYNSPNFTESYNSSTGLLTVTDGTNNASIAFDNFNATLDFASDGNGGTLITDPPTASDHDVSVQSSATADGVSGSITFADDQGSGAQSASFTPDGSDYLGHFSLGAVTQGNGAASVEFDFNNDQINLAPGKTLTQSYNVSVNDAQNPAASQNQTVSVSIGGPGNDHFVFAPGIGSDTITNFKPQQDTIELDHFANEQNVQELQSLVTTDVHGDAFINLGHSDSITLPGVTAAQMQQVIQAGHVLLH